MIRRLAIAAAIGLVVAACTAGSGDSTTTSSSSLVATTTTTLPVTTTSVTETTTTPPPATTTTAVPVDLAVFPYFEGVEFPDDPATVADLPEFMQAWVGAPAPDPDLTIAGPDDVERWLGEWLNWMGWMYANPEAGLEVVEEGFAPASPLLEQTRSGFEAWAQEGTSSFGVPFFATNVTSSFDLAEEFGVITLFVRASGQIGREYTADVETGEITSVSEPFDATPLLQIVLRALDREGEREWLVEVIDVVN